MNRHAHWLLARDLRHVRGVERPSRSGGQRVTGRRRGERNVRGCTELDLHVEAEARLGRLLLNNEVPAGIAGRHLGIEIEAEERHVGLQRTTEQRMDLLFDRTRLAAITDWHCRHRIHDGRRIAAEQDAAHEQHDLLAGTVGRFVFRELARTPFGDRGDIAVCFWHDGAPEAAEERRARIVDDKVAPQQLASHLDVEPEHERLDEALIRLQHGDTVDGHPLQSR